MHDDAVKFIRQNGGAATHGGFIPSRREQRPAKDFALLMQRDVLSQSYNIMSLRAVYRPKGDPAYANLLVNLPWSKYRFSLGNVLSSWPDGEDDTVSIMHTYGFLMELMLLEKPDFARHLHVLRQFSFMEECRWARQMIEATGPYKTVFEEDAY
jgi:hypothetical protein